MAETVRETIQRALLAETVRETIQRALLVATEAHEGQTRKLSGLPYVTHPIAVASAFAPYEGLLRSAALLHDVLEDTALTAADLRARGIDDRVISVVEELTRRVDESYMDFIRRIKGGSPAARMVKVADILHNMSDLPPGDSKVKRYREALLQLVA